MTERQNVIQDKFNFLKKHIKRKGRSKSSAFKSLHTGARARSFSDTQSIEISMNSNISHQPSITFWMKEAFKLFQTRLLYFYVE